jgi:hypothetical protein
MGGEFSFKIKYFLFGNFLDLIYKKPARQSRETMPPGAGRPGGQPVGRALPLTLAVVIEEPQKEMKRVKLSFGFLAGNPWKTLIG